MKYWVGRWKLLVELVILILKKNPKYNEVIIIFPIKLLFNCANFIPTKSNNKES